ncbi:MAG: RDD family protein [Patulibacter minatonensis]
MGNTLGSGRPTERGSQAPPYGTGWYREQGPQGTVPVRYVDPGFRDPYAHVPKPAPPTFPPATTAERIAAVVVDFVVVKLITTAIVISIAGVAMLSMVHGPDGEAQLGANTWLALGLSAVVSFVYFVLWPMRFHGRTIGRRVIGIGPGLTGGAEPQHRAVARHDFFLFFLPSLALDPITVLGWRDVAVLGVWCALQAWRTAADRTQYEESLGFGMLERPI